MGDDAAAAVGSAVWRWSFGVVAARRDWTWHQAVAGSVLWGWLTLAAGLLSPLHWLGEHLFTAHMIEHELIMAVAAPLLALARPIGAFLWAFPLSLRQRLRRAGRSRWVRSGWSVITSPAPATTWHGVMEA